MSIPSKRPRSSDLDNKIGSKPQKVKSKDNQIDDTNMREDAEIKEIKNEEPHEADDNDKKENVTKEEDLEEKQMTAQE